MSDFERLLVLAAATCVVAPLVTALVARLAAGLVHPRVPAGIGQAVSLAAAVAVAQGWRVGHGRELLLGQRLVGGSLIHIDGLTAIMLPLVALTMLAIMLVAPRRALTPEAVVRLLVGSFLTAAIMVTSHPAALVVLWVLSLLPTWVSTRSTPGGRPTARAYAIAMIAGSLLFTAGVGLMVIDPPWAAQAGTA